MRNRRVVISGFAVAGAAAGLVTVVAFKVRSNRAVVTFDDGRKAVAIVARSGDLRVACACGRPDCEHGQAAAVVAAAEVPRDGNTLWRTLHRSLGELRRHRSPENAETTARVAQCVIETEGLTITRAA